MIANVKEILFEARREKYAVGAFNIFNLESIQGAVRAAKAKQTPIILQVTEKTLNYAGDVAIFKLVESVIEKEVPRVPIGLHLDHGKSFDIVARAIEIGFTSVMLDASRLPLEENIHAVKRVVDYAHPMGVVVQAEIGLVPYLGETDQSVDWEELMTVPEEAAQLVDQTKVDTLAVCIGNAHGFFRERIEPDWERLEKIVALIPDTPIVLHGASDWSNHKVDEAVKRGVVCFNVDTDLRIAFNSSLFASAQTKRSLHDPRVVLADARDALQKAVEGKIDLFKRFRAQLPK